ncbi:MAG: response regulator, partial [Pseudanabaena sp.]
MSNDLYRLLLIDSDRIFRMGMRAWLAQFSDLEVVAEVNTAEAVFELLSDDAIDLDLILLDLNLERSNSEASSIHLSGLELCQQLKTKYPDLPILLLISTQPTEVVAIALRAGVEG